MNKLTYRIIVAGTFVCLSIVAYKFYVERAHVTALNSELTRVKASDEQRIAILNRQLTAAGRSAQTHVARTAAQHNRPPAKSAHRSFLSMRQDPVFRALWRKQQRRAIEREYADTISGLNLPGDKAARVKELLIERLDAQADAVALAREAHLPGDQITAAAHLATDAVNQDIEALIGKDDFEALNQPQASMFKPIVENSVGVDLSMAGVPLTASQVASVTQCFIKLYTSLSSAGHDSTSINPTTGLSPFYQSILSEAAANLSPTQVPIVRDYLLERMQEQSYLSGGQSTSASTALAK